jgi:iron complex outermembrane receptor protein
MNKQNYLKILLQTTAIISVSVGSAFAQETAQPGADQGEIVVTGSRIKKSNFSSPVSMDVLNAEDAKIQGIADIGGLLQTATAASGSNQVSAAISTAYVANGGVGSETVGLRGLGAGRTLDLINSRRAGPSGTRGSVSAFDLGSIPLLGVERVDILKDGASSVYGSDAIAGVINYITDKSDGAEIDLYTEIPENSGGEVFRGSATYGDSFDRGRFRITGDYYKREELARRDRSYLDCSESYTFNDNGLSSRADVIDPRTGANQCAGTIWGHVWAYQYAPDGSIADNVAQNPRNLIFQFDRGNNIGNLVPGIPASLDGTGLTAPAGWYQVEYGPDDIVGNPTFAGLNVDNRNPDRVTDLYPEMQRNDSVTGELERITLMGDVEFELTDTVTAYGEALFNRRTTHVNSHAQYWSYRYGFSDYGTTQANFTGDEGVGWVSTALEFSPTPVVEWGDETVDVDYFRLVGGLKGEFGDNMILPGWDWDIYAQHSDSHGEYTEQFIRNDSIRSTNYQTTSCVGDTTPGATATANNGETVSVAGVPCVDVRWFNPDFLAGELTDAERCFLLGTDTGFTDFTQTTIEGFVTGDVVDLPAGKVGAAFGAFFQRDEILDRPSDTTLTGNEFFGSSAGITSGVQKTNALYAEASIPLLADKPLMDRLELIASGRYTDITSEHPDGRSASVDGFNYRATLNWQVSPAIRLRGSTGTSFRAPALFEQFLANESSSRRQSDIDPCIGWTNALNDGDISQTVATNCAADGIPGDYLGAPISANETRGGGFGQLMPETSTNYTVGFVLSPDLDFADVSFSFDYFDITVEDEIQALSGAQIVGGCYTSENFATEPLCDLFTRGNIIGGTFRITDVFAQFVNIDTQTNRGIDASLRVNKDTKWGNLNINTQVSHQIEDNIKLLATSETRFLNGAVGEPEWTGILNVTFAPTDNLLVRWGADYIGSTSVLRSVFDTTSVLPIGGGQHTELQLGEDFFTKTETEAMIYHSVSAQWEVDGGWTFRAGINNLFDEHPPALTNINDSPDLVFAGNSPLVSQYDLVGRRAFFNVSKKFQ